MPRLRVRRRSLWRRIAYGSGRELRNQLAIAEIDGGLSASELEQPRALLERELRLLWGLTRHRR